MYDIEARKCKKWKVFFCLYYNVMKCYSRKLLLVVLCYAENFLDPMCRCIFPSAVGTCPVSVCQVGQYLMTLPQHLEPFMTQHDPTLGRALQSGVMPYRSVSRAASERRAALGTGRLRLALFRVPSNRINTWSS